MTKAAQKDEMSQSDKFKEAARNLECDLDEKRWGDKLRRVVQHEPVPGEAM